MAKKILSVIFHIFVYLLAFFPFIMCFVFMWDSCNKRDDYYRLEDTAVTVQAAITSIEQDSSGDSTTYDTYITYKYGDTVYSNIEYKEFHSKPALGQIEEIEIDPENPTHFRPTHDGTTQLVLCCTFIVLGMITITHLVSSSVAHHKAKKNHSTLYKSPVLSSSVVREALDFEKKERARISIFASGALVLLVSGFAVFHILKTTITPLVPYALTLVSFLLLYLLYYTLSNKSTGDIYISEDFLHEIKEESDSESTSIVWYFSKYGRWNPNKKLIVSATNKSTDDYYIGSKFYLVTKESNHRNLLRLYDANDFRI